MSLDKLIQEVEVAYIKAVKADNGETFMRLSSMLGTLDQQVREGIQDLTENDLKKIINKLKGGATPTKQELELMELWIVGDAEQYAYLENNYPDWQKELQRLIDDIGSMAKASLTISEATRLRGIIYDAVRVCGDIEYYLQQKDRIKNFKEATESIDAEERQTLIRLLEQKMQSAQF